MSFFTDKSEFNYNAKFYGIPLYCAFDEEGIPIFAGRNKIYDLAFFAMSVFHNYAINGAAQIMAAITGAPYEPGFPFDIEPIGFDGKRLYDEAYER